MELLENIKFYSENSHYAFHCPIHLGKTGFPEDLTELPGLDNMEYPEASIKKAQNEIADYFNAEASFFNQWSEHRFASSFICLKTRIN